MKIPVQRYMNMDSKLKFSDRLKALLNTEARHDIDPYVFSEPDTVMSIKHLDTSKTYGSKPKCPRKRIKLDTLKLKCPGNVPALDPRRLDGDIKNFEMRCSNGQSTTRSKEKINCGNGSSLFSNETSSRRLSRDHTLLYYPRAGDEISDSDSSTDEQSVYQRHWFTGDATDVPRAVRLSIQRSQLRRRLIQLHRCGKEAEELLYKRTRRLLQAAYRSQKLINERLIASTSNGKAGNNHLFVGGRCLAEGCGHTSLPCTRHCSRHIMMNTDQLLFEHCTAKFSDNTQCCIPVFDVAHELPLCPEHARKRDNYHRKAQESKPKKTRKKTSSPIIPRPKSNGSNGGGGGGKSRPKKRKRPPIVKSVDVKSKVIPEENEHYPSPIMGLHDNSDTTKTLNNLNSVTQSTSNQNNLNLGLGLGGLGLGSGPKVDIGDHEVFAVLDPSEHDFGSVLNTLPADAFNDLFIESRNGEYEPSREEEEELERALEAVDKDVRNLERMGQTHGLLEPGLLAQLMSDIAS